jgi:outer membrane murein-binding lipoprotein Lpp
MLRLFLALSLTAFLTAGASAQQAPDQVAHDIARLHQEWPDGAWRSSIQAAQTQERDLNAKIAGLEKELAEAKEKLNAASDLGRNY